jgi:magnesium transporter
MRSKPLRHALTSPARFVRRRTRHAPGTPPGTIRRDTAAPKPVIRALAYGPDGCTEEQVEDLDALAPLRAAWPVIWVNVDGLGDPETIRALGEFFGLHPLALEDVVNTHQRPKHEDYGGIVYVVMRMPHADQGCGTEQISLFLGPGFVVSFQERPGDCLEPVRRRLRDGKGRVRRHGADYLLYALMDAVVDGYFPCLDGITEQMEELEVEVLERTRKDAHCRIHDCKTRLLAVRRAIAPLRDAVNSLLRDDGESLEKETRIHMRDVYDHTLQILDLVDAQREIAASLLDMHLSAINTRMNEIMKVLTIIATLFIPLTFIAGIYGMNFDYEASSCNMPELYMRYGYPTLILAMVGVVAVELLLFWRLGWFASGTPGRQDTTPRSEDNKS